MTLDSAVVVPKAAHLICQSLRGDILSGRLHPGEALPTPDDLCRRFAVSRPTVREALSLLESQGLVRLKRGPRGGAIVQRPDYGTVTHALGDLLEFEQVTRDDLLEALAILEPAAARLAATRATPEDVREMEASIARLEAVFRDPMAWTRETIAFHAAVTRASHSPVLAVFRDSLSELVFKGAVALSTTVKERAAALEDHRGILEAIRIHDEGTAERVARGHALERRLRRLAALPRAAGRGRTKSA